jgi:hypothetical protein
MHMIKSVCKLFIKYNLISVKPKPQPSIFLWNETLLSVSYKKALTCIIKRGESIQ